MAKMYVATVQVLMRECDSADQATDAIQGLMENEYVKDWAFLRVGGQYMFPQERTVMEDYEEGDFLR